MENLLMFPPSLRLRLFSILPPGVIRNTTTPECLCLFSGKVSESKISLKTPDSQRSSKIFVSHGGHFDKTACEGNAWAS